MSWIDAYWPSIFRVFACSRIKSGEGRSRVGRALMGRDLRIPATPRLKLRHVFLEPFISALVRSLWFRPVKRLTAGAQQFSFAFSVIGCLPYANKQKTDCSSPKTPFLSGLHTLSLLPAPAYRDVGEDLRVSPRYRAMPPHGTFQKSRLIALCLNGDGELYVD